MDTFLLLFINSIHSSLSKGMKAAQRHLPCLNKLQPLQLRQFG
jgi:hypothetical protein